MEKLSNEEVARVYNYYTGCEVSITGHKDKHHLSACIIARGGKLSIYTRSEKGYISNRLLGMVKLLLTPLHKISDEDLQTLIDILLGGKRNRAISITRVSENSTQVTYKIEEVQGEEYDSVEMLLHIFGNELYNTWLYHHKKGIWHKSQDLHNSHLLTQFLIQRGYAVPLFIAPNHPANGKDAIELGIATSKE